MKSTDTDALLARIDSRQDELIALTQDLVRIPTVNPPGDAYEACARLLGERLRKRGFAVEYLRAEGAPLGWLPVARGALLAVGVLWSGWLGMRLIFDRAPNLQRAVLALPGLGLALSVAAAAWILVFWLW